MKTNDAARQLIMKWETLQLRAYLCPAGIPTIGYGHTGDVTMADVKTKRTITRHEAETIFELDLEYFEERVSKFVKVKLNENQFGALVAFAFNVGAGDPPKGKVNFTNSSLLKYVNAGQLKSATNEFGKWVYGKDPKTKEMVKLPGLVKRRAEEAALFNRVVYVA